MKRESFFLAVAGGLHGHRAARERLVAELRDHVDDAIADEVAAGRPPAEAERVAVARLGSPEEIAASWQSYVARRRRETRKRAAILALAAATASSLAVAQHASGLRQPGRACATPAPAHAEHARAVACDRALRP